MLDYHAKTQLIVWSLLVFKKVIVQKKTQPQTEQQQQKT